MSNIYTSYLRIYRNDKATITPEEVDFITNHIIKWHDDFGSYRVPILIENNTEFNCLDIQYGSGKGLYHLYDFIVEHENTYTIWHRLNDEGTDVDCIQRVYYSDKKDIPEYDFRPCKYAFDEIHILNCPSDIINSTTIIWQPIDNGFKTSFLGYYHSSNGQFGEGKMIEPHQKYNLLRAIDLFEWCSEKSVLNLLEEAQKNIEKNIPCKVFFFYKKRKVAEFCWEKHEEYFAPNQVIIGLAYDDWDNCADELFMQFNNSYKNLNT